MGLAEFVAQTRDDPFVWGQNDCALWCASAVARGTGYDPAADLRGRYASWWGHRQIVQAAGGLLALITPRMEGHGLRPLEGDGVAVLRVDRRLICAVLLEGRAVLRMGQGLRVTDEFEIVRGWSWSRQ